MHLSNVTTLRRRQETAARDAFSARPVTAGFAASVERRVRLRFAVGPVATQCSSLGALQPSSW